MDKKLIASATDKLNLKDIVIHSFSLSRSEELDPEMYPDNFSQESMHGVRGEKFSYTVDFESVEIKKKQQEESVLRAYVSFGVRAVKEDREELDISEDEVTVCFTIEATYRVDYQVTKDISDEEIEEFLKFNSVHNAWPFWRQFVFQTVKSAGLPALEVPLMKGRFTAPKKGKKKI